MWFIFPQLTGLGHSPLAQRYAIRDLDQARRYLADPMLGSRLRNDVGLMIDRVFIGKPGPEGVSRRGWVLYAYLGQCPQEGGGS